MPLAVTDCLNLANPDRPEVYWQLERVVAGIADACRTLGLPVVSGNVSLYNEEAGAGGIHPTPVIGAVGLLEDYRTRLQAGFRKEGDFVLLVGASRDELGGSEYLKVIEGATGEHPPQLDLGTAISVNQFVLSAAAAGMLASAHDVAEGGLLVALAECCLASGIGVRCPPLAEHSGLSLTGAFFGESQSRFVVSVGPRAMPEIQSLARRLEVEVLVLGMAGGDALEFEGQLRVSLEQMRLAYEGALA
jgi:phosphoribosylformylglycinamidine synthase